MAIKTARKQIRYQRNDINAAFKKKPVLFSRLQPMKILNISKQGIAICSNQTLQAKNRLEIRLSFRSGQTFLLNGLVVHSFNNHGIYPDDDFVELYQQDSSELIPLPFKYGIFFDRQYPAFGDFLIESGCRNGFEVLPQGFYRRQTP